MKKLFLILTLIGTATLTQAQYHNGNDRYDHYDDNTYARNDRNNRYDTNRDWRYDDNYRRTKGNVGTINSFQRDAREHIARGIVEGSITSREAARLLAIAEDIERKENHYMRRGGLNHREVAELKNDLRQLDKMIWRERRDNDHMSVDSRYPNGRRN